MKEYISPQRHREHRELGFFKKSGDTDFLKDLIHQLIIFDSKVQNTILIKLRSAKGLSCLKEPVYFVYIIC